MKYRILFQYYLLSFNDIVKRAKNVKNNLLANEMITFDAFIVFVLISLIKPSSNLFQNNIGTTEPLIDDEGYPRSDIDVYQVRHARHQIKCKSFSKDGLPPLKYITRMCKIRRYI